MIRAKMSLLFFSLFVAVWAFIPARYSHADRVKTETETYSSSSGIVTPPAVGRYRCDLRETKRSPVPGVEEKRSTETCGRPDMDSPLAGSEYQYKHERTESHVSSAPGSVERKTRVEAYRRSDADSAPPVESEYRYQYRSERLE